MPRYPDDEAQVRGDNRRAGRRAGLLRPLREFAEEFDFGSGREQRDLPRLAEIARQEIALGELFSAIGALIVLLRWDGAPALWQRTFAPRQLSLIRLCLIVAHLYSYPASAFL